MLSMVLISRLGQRVHIMQLFAKSFIPGRVYQLRTTVCVASVLFVSRKYTVIHTIEARPYKNKHGEPIVVDQTLESNDNISARRLGSSEAA